MLSYLMKCILISNFLHGLNVVRFLLGNSVESEFYMPTFRNTLSVPSSYAGRYEERLDLRKVGIFIREKVWLENSLNQRFRLFSAYKIQTPRNYPEESVQQNVFVL